MPAYRTCSLLFAILKKIELFGGIAGELLTQPGRLGQIAPGSDLFSSPQTSALAPLSSQSGR